MAPFPSPEFLGDYRTPTNVMVTFPSGTVGQGLGDCQAVPVSGKNGGQEAGISLHAARFIYKGHPRVLSQRMQGEYPSSSPIAHKSKSIFPARNVLKRICSPTAMLTVIFLFPGLLGCSGERTHAFLTRPTGCSLTKRFFQQRQGKKKKRIILN